MNPNGVRSTDPQPDVELGLKRGLAATLQMLGLPGSAYLYNGEEFGTPDHTEMPDEFRQDPAFERKGRTEAGRDGCRVPLAWEADAPAFGFSETGETWLPQPEAYRAVAADVQKATEGSTFSLYQKALKLRKEYNLGLGSHGWLTEFAGSSQVLAFANNDVIVLTNFGAEDVVLPADAKVLISSQPLQGNCVPTDVCVWIAAA